VGPPIYVVNFRLRGSDSTRSCPHLVSEHANFCWIFKRMSIRRFKVLATRGSEDSRNTSSEYQGNSRETRDYFKGADCRGAGTRHATGGLMEAARARRKTPVSRLHLKHTKKLDLTGFNFDDRLP
jgi:hypothetical protein